MQDRPQEGKLDSLNQKLYSPNSPEILNKQIRPLTEKNTDVLHDWQHETEIEDENELILPKKKNSKVGAWLFTIIALIFCAGSFYFAWDYIVNKVGAGQNVVISVIGPVSTAGGRDYEMEVEIQNKNSFPIELVDLVVDFPPGTKDVSDISRDLPSYREGLGTINPGEIVSRKVKAVLFGSEREKQEIVARAEYHIPNSNAPFDRSKSVDVLIETAPVEFVLDTLKEATIGQEVTLNLRVRSNTDKELKDILVKAEYPSGFTFASAFPEPITENNIWNIDTLGALGTSTIKIKGTFSGDANADRFFRFEGGVADKVNPKVIAGLFATSLERVTLTKPFLATTLKIDDSELASDYVTTAGRPITAKIEYTNNLDIPITDVTIELKLSGNALDKKNLNSSTGYYKSTENKIIWNKSTNEELANVEPGKVGAVTFGINTLPFEAYTALVKGQEITMDVSVTGKRPSESRVPEDIKSTIVRKVKVESDLGIVARSVYYVGPFTNSGPIPPKAEQETTYTVVLTLTNTSNDLNNVSVEGSIPPYVVWKNQVYPEGDRVSFDDKTGKVVWNVGNVSAGTGYTKPAREVAFQVGITPSTNQIGEIPFLLQNMSLLATDTFTGTKISRPTREAVTIRISTDPNYVNGSDRVSE